MTKHNGYHFNYRPEPSFKFVGHTATTDWFIDEDQVMWKYEFQPHCKHRLAKRTEMRILDFQTAWREGRLPGMTLSPFGQTLLPKLRA